MVLPVELGVVGQISTNGKNPLFLGAVGWMFFFHTVWKMGWIWCLLTKKHMTLMDNENYL